MARMTNKKAQAIQRAAERGGARRSVVSGAGGASPVVKLDKRKMRPRVGGAVQGPLMKSAQAAADKFGPTTKRAQKFRTASVGGKSVKKAKAIATGGE